MRKKIESYLLESACPSIKYRVKKEVRNDISLSEEEILLKEIMNDDLVRDISFRQNDDGWIDQDFHHEKGVETAVRVLAQKGIGKNHIYQKNMLCELEKREKSFDNGCLDRVGKVLDDKGFGGSNLIRATIFTYAGEEEKDFIKVQLKNALIKFNYLLGVNNLTDIIEPYKNKYVFKEGVMWPSIYDLRILAYTYGWRSNENINMLITAVQKLINLSPIPKINVLHKSQLISPGSFCMHNFNPELISMKDKDWMMWFHRIELLSRLGVVKYIKELKEQVYYLINLLEESDGLFTKRLSHNYFNKWGTYTGLALEKDWRTKERRICDLTFRSLLIIHYSEVIVDELTPTNS